MITVNFASKNYRLFEWIRLALIAAVVVLSLFFLGMIWKSVTLRMGIAAIEKNLKERKTIDEQIQPLLKEREQVVKDLSAMTGLIEAKKFSWTKLLTRLEATVPIGAAFKTIEYNPDTHALTLDGAAQTPEALRTLVQELEKSSYFKEPFLKHQSIDKGSISFNVVAVYRENSAVGTTAAKR